MSNDQLERELEDFFARSATDAVPDTRRAPAPPWREQQRRSRVSDVRRFGRATPWLVAAVLLVIAGLGIGAAVGFDASGPDREGPVATDPASPAPTGTVSAPHATPTTTPTSAATFARTGGVVAPDDGVSAFTVGFGSYGPVHIGMTQAQALAARGLTAADLVDGYGTTCPHAVPMTGQDAEGRVSRAIVDDSAGGTVIGFIAAVDARDSFGNGVGTTFARLVHDYPTGTVATSASGWVFEVSDGGGSLGFEFGTVGTPTGTDTVAAVLSGTVQYAAGYEVCQG